MKLTREKLSEPWTKFVFHKVRYPDNISEKITNVLDWCTVNIPDDQVMTYVVDRNNAALVYIRDEASAMLFQIAMAEHASDSRGRKIWR